MSLPQQPAPPLHSVNAAAARYLSGSVTPLKVALPPLQPKSPDTASNPKQEPVPDTRVRVLCLPELEAITKPDTNYQ